VMQTPKIFPRACFVVQCVKVCGSVLKWVAVRCSALQRVARVAECDGFYKKSQEAVCVVHCGSSDAQKRLIHMKRDLYI